MDSLTQLVLGATCGEAVLGKQVGRKAPLWGAILGTLPDLDVLIPLGGPVNDFVYHRGFSHSLILLALLSPLVAWLIIKLHAATRQFYLRWVLLVFVVFEASVLIDLMTIYGTQIFWPFDTTPRAIPVLFIIDPFFTLPILLGLLASLFMPATLLRKNRSLGHCLNTIGLCISLTYLGWAFMAGEYVKHSVAKKLARQQIPYSQFIVSPTPFNTLLWRIVGIDEDRYFETYFSVFDQHNDELFIDVYPRNLSLIAGIEEHPPIAKLKHFTRGYYAVSKVEDYVTMTDLRMGAEPSYVFEFKVARLNKSNPVPVNDERVDNPRGWSSLNWVWLRIWRPIPRNGLPSG